jgi:hypothetical protein
MLGVADIETLGVIDTLGVADIDIEGVTDVLGVVVTVTDGVIDTLGVGLGGTYALTCIISKPPPLPFLVKVKPP